MTEMNQLCESHPSVYEEFMKGKHAVSRSTRPFSQIWADMALEQSVNLDSKTQGGIVGISQKPGALERWFLTSHDRAAITSATKIMCGMQNADDSGSHKEAGKQRMKRDEGDVQKLSSVFSSKIMRNPFTLSTEDVLPLINIVTGTKTN